MSLPKYTSEMYLKEFDTIVKEANEKFIVLEDTIFYPSSGGVLNDEGTITLGSGEDYKVVFVGKFSGNISHEVDRLGLKSGDKVHLKLDWGRRYTLMRYHTAAHVLSGVFSKEYGARITGNQLTLEKGRIDFDLENFDKTIMQEYFKKANEIIKKDLEVKAYVITREEAEKNKTLFKLAKVLPESLKEIRVVDIVGFDAQADGGCHVKSLKEVGSLTFVKADNKGKNNRRVYFTI